MPTEDMTYDQAEQSDYWLPKPAGTECAACGATTGYMITSETVSGSLVCADTRGCIARACPTRPAVK